MFGFGRVPVEKTIEVPVRGGVTDGETVVVHGAGDGGFAKIKTVLGEMSEPGEPGDLAVRVGVLRGGEASANEDERTNDPAARDRADGSDCSS